MHESQRGTNSIMFEVVKMLCLKLISVCIKPYTTRVQFGRGWGVSTPYQQYVANWQGVEDEVTLPTDPPWVEDQQASKPCLAEWSHCSHLYSARVTSKQIA